MKKVVWKGINYRFVLNPDGNAGFEKFISDQANVLFNTWLPVIGGLDMKLAMNALGAELANEGFKLAE